MENTIKNYLIRLNDKPWVWAFAGAIVLWGVTVTTFKGQGAGQMITVALSFSVFFVIVGIGQMYVITTGPGNVDLSIPANMALTGSIAMRLMDG